MSSVEKYNIQLIEKIPMNQQWNKYFGLCNSLNLLCIIILLSSKYFIKNINDPDNFLEISSVFIMSFSSILHIGLLIYFFYYKRNFPFILFFYFMLLLEFTSCVMYNNYFHKNYSITLMFSLISYRVLSLLTLYAIQTISI